MAFQWQQFRSRRGQMQRWGLIHKDTGKAVLAICISNKASTEQNYKLRKKIKRAYEWYYSVVSFLEMEFF